MLQVYPDYYREFHCIAGACRHNCCIGWEIDIDPDTLAYYDSLPGPMGERLRSAIAREGDPRFAMGEDGRCPFLNGDNLCDIILELGESHICAICTDHPRFRNELPGRVETGLGLCCEEACRIILTREMPMRLVCEGETDTEDGIIDLRDEALCILSDRTRPLFHRLDAVLDLCGAVMPDISPAEWADFLLSLEQLDGAWTERLTDLLEHGTEDPSAFESTAAGRETEEEQFAAYLLYRHLANAADAPDLAARAAFAVWGVEFLRALGTRHLARTGQFTTADRIELARLFSSEIEYAEENLYAVLDVLTDVQIIPTDESNTP